MIFQLFENFLKLILVQLNNILFKHKKDYFYLKINYSLNLLILKINFLIQQIFLIIYKLLLNLHNN